MVGPADMSGPMTPRIFRVASKRRETADTVTLAFDPLEGPQIELRPGQFDMLYAFGIGEVPISMSGMSEGSVLHTVRAVGAVTRAIYDAGEGDVFGMRGPYGNGWGLEDHPGADVLIVAGGIGLAPLRPAIEHVLAHRELHGKLSVLIGARSPELLIFQDDIARWQARLDAQVRVTIDVAPSEWRGAVGLVTELIPRVSFDPGRTVALVCGPEIMMRAVATDLMDLGVASDQIRISMERNMKCAIGHCGHCQFGPEFVCKDGPIFPYERVESLMRVREV
ncbi:MAG: FAD/NAD(P)-binding protein [Actinobacteria bacterium]|nr:FAD/NAD(P)-binding protein [Actinomycetota bacterium]